MGEHHNRQAAGPRSGSDRAASHGTSEATKVPEAARLASLDQFRGYTVLGMFVVNFLGTFRVMPDLLRHHPTYVTYADAVMPQFFLAAGFAARLTMLRRRQSDGPRAAYLRAARRCLGLLLLGLVVHGVDGRLQSRDELRSLGLGGFLSTAFQRNYFQTLVH